MHPGALAAGTLPQYNTIQYNVGLNEEGEVNKRKVDTPDELLARILDAATSIKRGEDQLRRTAGDLRTRFAKCFEVDGGIFRTFIVNCNRFVI